MNSVIKMQELFDIIVRSYRIPRHIFSIDSQNLSDLDFHFRRDIMPDFDYRLMFQEMTNSVSEDYPVDYEDSFGTHYIVFKYENLPEDSYEVLGPIMYSALRATDLMPIIESHGISTAHFDDVKHFYFRITIISDALSFRYLLNNIISSSLGAECHLHNQRTNYSRIEEEKHDIDTLIPKSVAAFAAMEARYDVERRLLEAVKEGNIQEALHCYNLFMGFTLEERSGDPLRDGKNMVIAVDTLLRKAAQQAYVHPLHLDDISRKMVIEIEHTTSLVELSNLCGTMIRKYCLLVKSYSRAEYSPLIRDILNYIDFHYQEKIALADLADKFAVSKNHLSFLFHQEVGQTLTDYTNLLRIDRSILLLNTTSDSMPLIAEKCGFSDANYFTRTFRKYKNMSPLQYRQMMNAKEPPREN